MRPDNGPTKETEARRVREEQCRPCWPAQCRRRRRRRARRRRACQRMPPCRTCTRTQTTHTSAHALPHAHTLQPTAKLTRPRTCQCAHTLSRAHTQTHNATRSLARMGAHAPAHPAGWTTCADELLQLRQPLEAQGVELQQLRLSKAALFAAAEATASRNRDTSTRRKHRAIKSATNDTTGWPSCSRSGRKGQDGHLRLRLTEGSLGAPPCQPASEWAHRMNSQSPLR